MAIIIGLISVAILITGIYFLNRGVERSKKIGEEKHQRFMNDLMQAQASNIRIAIAGSWTLEELDKQEKRIELFDVQYGMTTGGQVELSDLRGWLENGYTRLLKEILRLEHPINKEQPGYNDHCK